MERKVRVGLVGFGAIGRHHARNLRSMASVEFVGVTDSSEGACAEANHAGCVTFESIEALLDQRLDAAVICVPTKNHEEVAEAFIERSCALLIEKPLAQTMESARRIIDRCEAAKVPLMVGYVERYNPAIDAVRRFVTQGNLGRIISMSARRVGVLPPRIKDANVLIDIGVHDIDIVAFITNARLKILAAQGGMALLTDRLDYATLALEVAGVAVSIDTNWVTPVKIRELSITGSHGYCHVDYITQDARFAPGRSFAPTSTYEALVAQHVQGTMIPLPVEKAEPLARELHAFITGVRDGGLPDPKIALASLRIAEEATQLIAKRHYLNGNGGGVLVAVS